MANVNKTAKNRDRFKWELHAIGCFGASAAAPSMAWSFLIVCVLSASGLLSALGTPAECGEESSRNEVRLVFVGDVMLADGPGKFIADGGDPFAEFADLFDSADLVVGNLECVVATGGVKEDKPWTFRAHPHVIPLLTRYFHAVSAANNHSGDFGRAALCEQFRLFDEAQMPYFGAGPNRNAAHRPLILKRRGVRIALLGYNDYPPRRFEATDDRPGTAWIDRDVMTSAIATLRQREPALIIIPYLHWGEEEERRHNAEQETLAKAMIDAGADLVVGAHPHVVQDVGEHRGRPIFYSLGNFVFDNFDDPECYKGCILSIDMAGRNVVRWSMTPVQIDQQGIPHRTAAKRQSSTPPARQSPTLNTPNAPEQRGTSTPF